MVSIEMDGTAAFFDLLELKVVTLEVQVALVVMVRQEEEMEDPMESLLFLILEQ